MTYEEKRAMHLCIAQMLADEGLNKARLKEMVEAEIQKRVDAAIDSTLKSLNAHTSCGDYIKDYVHRYVHGPAVADAVRYQLKEELGRRIINIEFKENVYPSIKHTDNEEGGLHPQEIETSLHS